jgi:hypothetical protein
MITQLLHFVKHSCVYCDFYFLHENTGASSFLWNVRKFGKFTYKVGYLTAYYVGNGKQYIPTLLVRLTHNYISGMYYAETRPMEFSIIRARAICILAKRYNENLDSVQIAQKKLETARQDLQSVIKSFSWGYRAKIEPLGSMASGLFNEKSDLDFMVTLQ